MVKDIRKYLHNNHSGSIYKASIEMFWTKTIKSAMKNKSYYFTTLKELSKTLIDHLEDDSFTANEGNKYNKFLDTRSSINAKANALYNTKQQRV